MKLVFLAVTLLSSASSLASGLHVDSVHTRTARLSMGPLEQIRLPAPVLPVKVAAVTPFDVKVSGHRAWVSAQTFMVPSPGMGENGPLVLWENERNHAFLQVTLPNTTIAYLPEIC